MTEYIERDALLDDISAAVKHGGMGEIIGQTLMRYVKRQPAANVAPVVLGWWTHLGGDEWCCSACGFVITTEGSWDKPTKKHCEDCGAKMDGGAENA